MVAFAPAALRRHRACWCQERILESMDECQRSSHVGVDDGAVIFEQPRPKPEHFPAVEVDGSPAMRLPPIGESPYGMK
jgi:hypothetical protein